MRIGTWNLEGRWTADHAALIAQGRCDLWLLTEVADNTDLQPMTRSEPMQQNKSWAAVFGSGFVAQDAPHPAMAVAKRGPLLACSLVLPFRSAGARWPGAGTDVGTRTEAALAALEASVDASGGPTIIGGDFNHGLKGAERVGSRTGRRAITSFLERRSLRAPTADLPHRLAKLSSIDHVAIPKSWAVLNAERIAVPDRLSDHDAYVIEVRLP